MVQGHAEVATKSERISSTRRGKRFRSYVAGQKRVSISQSLSDSGLIGRNPLSPIHLSHRSFDEGEALSSLTLIFPSSFLILTFFVMSILFFLSLSLPSTPNSGPPPSLLQKTFNRMK